MLPITALKIVAPVAILAAGFAGATWLTETAPQLERQQPAATLPLVEVLPVQLQVRELDVSTHGELSPSNVVQLAAEVSARVIWTSPKWKDGAFFHGGDDLLRLDPVDFQLAVTSAEAKLAQADAALQMEQAEAASALQDWKEHGQGEAPPLVAREPQLAMARANVQAASAGLKQAHRSLNRCTIQAPMDGRVQAAGAEVGQFVGAGAVVGQIYATRRAEVRLPVQMRDLAWLDLPLGSSTGDVGIAVELSAAIGGVMQHWAAKIVRTEASLDARNRMITAVAEIDDPYALRKSAKYPALIPGMFLHAKLQGKSYSAVATLPRAVLRDDGTVLVVGKQDRIQIRPVEIIRTDATEVHIASGLQDGELVCLTPLNVVVADMQVRIAAATGGQK